MSNQIKDPNSFDQYMRASIDQVQYEFDGADWTTLRSMLDKHDQDIDTAQVSPRYKHWLKWLIGGTIMAFLTIYFSLQQINRTSMPLDVSTMEQAEINSKQSDNSSGEQTTFIASDDEDNRTNQERSFEQTTTNPTNSKTDGESINSLQMVPLPDKTTNETPTRTVQQLSPLLSLKLTPLASDEVLQISGLKLSEEEVRQMLFKLDSLQQVKRKMYLIW